MSEVWVTRMLGDLEYGRGFSPCNYHVDFEEASLNTWKNERGQPLPPDAFPSEIYLKEGFDDYTYIPHLWKGTYIYVSIEVAEILKQFNMGKGALYKTRLFEVDRKTPYSICPECYCLNFGNVKEAFLGKESPNARIASKDPESNYRKLPYVPKDGDIAVSTAALQGPDLWLDHSLNRALFLSGRLADALKAAGLDQDFGLTRCRIIND